MNSKERLEVVFEGGVPDQVPHFELVFQLTREAFGMSWPTREDFQKASERERAILFDKHLSIWEKIISRYHWAAIQLPVSLYGFFDGQVIPEGRKRFGHEVMIYDFNGHGTFWMPTGSNMMDFVVKLYEKPEQLHEEAREKASRSIELARKQVDQGVDFICINSDYGYNEGPFISPELFAEFVTPYLEEITSAMHTMETKAILHSDGDLRKILDQLVSANIDGYQSIDPQGHMDIAEVKKIYGDRLILMGNVQTSILQETNKEEIKKSVKYCMTHGKPGGRYIFSTSNCIFAGMPLESYHIMLEAYRTMAAY